MMGSSALCFLVSPAYVGVRTVWMGREGPEGGGATKAKVEMGRQRLGAQALLWEGVVFFSFNCVLALTLGITRVRGR